MKAIHLVSLFNRWSGECQPVRAFEDQADALTFISQAQTQAREAIALPESTETEECTKEAAWDEFESVWGFSVLQAQDLTHGAIPVGFPAA